MTALPPVDEITTAVLDLLNASGFVVWDGAYGGSPTAPAYPYGVLYALFGGDSDPLPELDGRHDSVTLPFQVTSVSDRRNQCQALGARLRGQMLAGVLPVVAGWACVERRMDPVMPGVDRVGEPPNVVFSEPARYLLTYSPSSA